MFEHLREDGQYALLRRMEGEVPGYLSYSADEGEVLCVFGGIADAQEFYELWRVRIPGEGWSAVRVGREVLTAVAGNFDLVSVNPRPTPGEVEYLIPVEDFVRDL